MRRDPRLVWPAALLLGLALAAGPARAADQTVSATPSDTFAPAAVTIDVGDTVTWNNTGGSHNVSFDDGSFDMPANPSSNAWSVPRTFRAAGTFRYVCEAHEDDGMIGTVTVSGTGSQGPPPGDSPGGGGPGGDPGGGPGQGQGPGADTTRPIVSRFGIAKARLRSGRRTSFRFRLSEPADVRIAISRAVKRRGRTRWVAKGAVVRRDAGQGPNSVSFAGRSRGKPLAAGRYRAAIVATDEAGNRSRPKRASFRILA